ncbi:ATP-binding protein [Candidatus Woesearchaeota archaeon]|nr:ATP-binding protein [Candidatus Woesearchaeota archaeon]
MELSALETFNGWWKTGAVRKELLRSYKRHLYQELRTYLAKRQILLLQGLRRMGKSTMLFQLIDELLKETNPKHILYFSFDEIAYDIKDVLELYQKGILGKTFGETQERIYILFDEVHKVNDWENKIKTYYDLYPSLKFVLSGSVSVALKRAKESLAGRIYDFILEPLSFAEFLEMKSKPLQEIMAQPDLWKREVLPLLYIYVKYGTFPELVDETDETTAQRYILQGVIERILYKDLPEEFNIKDVELLKALLYLLGKHPGMLVSYKALAADLGRDQKTIAAYFDYLNFGLLTQFVFNYRGSPLASLRKLKKVYFTTPNFIFALNGQMESVWPYVLENIVQMCTKAGFFYKNTYEIDFIMANGKQKIALEVKSGNIKTKQFKYFREQEEDTKCFIIDWEDDGNVGDVPIIPVWKLLLFGIG